MKTPIFILALALTGLFCPNALCADSYRIPVEITGLPVLTKAGSTLYVDRNRELFSKIQHKCDIPTGFQGNSPSVLYVMKQDGSIIDAKLHYSSGVDSLDSCVVQAVKEVEPLSPIPSNARKTELRSIVTFGPHPDTSSDCDFSQYLAKMQKKINRNWRSGPPSEGKVVVLFVVDREGNLVDSAIAKSTDSKLMEDKALDAVRKSFPLSPLPECYKASSIVTEFTFGTTFFH